MKKLNKILWGIAFLVIGTLFALNTLGITNVEVFFDGWWTLFLIVPCTIGLITDRDKMGNFFGLCIGVFLLLGCQEIVPFDLIWKLIIPIGIILIGLKLIFGAIFGGRKRKEIKIEIEKNGGSSKNYCAVFSGQDVRIEKEIFEGANVIAVFGGVDLNLKNAVFEHDCVINTTAIFGGVDIFLPEHVCVKTNMTTLFGGVSNEQEGKDVRESDDAELPVTVYINGVCLFGGVELQ